MLWFTHRKVEREVAVITQADPTHVAIIPDGTRLKCNFSMAYRVRDKNIVIHEEWVPRKWWVWVRSWMPTTKR